MSKQHFMIIPHPDHTRDQHKFEFIQRVDEDEFNKATHLVNTGLGACYEAFFRTGDVLAGKGVITEVRRLADDRCVVEVEDGGL